MKIALFGKMRSGKGSVANILVEEFKFKSFSFSMGIKEIIEKYYPETRTMGKPRKYYTHVGQELRVLNEDIWINYTLGYANKNIGNTLIDDGRQVNEAIKLKNEGYIIVKVVADEELRRERILKSGDEFSEECLNHDTEMQVDLIEEDYIIHNDGSLEDLRDKVLELMDLLAVKVYSDLKVGDKVQVKRIINVNNKAEHLKKYIGKEGHVFSWIVDVDRNKKYKVFFKDRTTAYFYREELEG